MKQIPAIFSMILLTGTAFAQTQPGTTTTTVQTVPVQAAPTVAPTAPVAPNAAVTAPVAPAVQAAPVTPVSLQEQFKGQLPFILDEQKMIAFAEASRQVKRINNKWDVQIAGAETDQRAIEYNNFSVEEITKSLQNIPGLTLEQYTAMTKLTATNPEFNRVYSAYKDLLEQGKIKAPAAAVAVPVKPVVKPVAAPVQAK